MTTSDSQFQQVSFVNGICTTNGGSHVNYVVSQIVDKLKGEATKKNKKVDVKPYHIKNNIFIFVNALIENPSFDS